MGEGIELPAASTSPAAARKWATDRLESWGEADLVDTVTLLVTELVTNVLLHARTPCELRIVRGDRLRVEVVDGSARVPEQRRLDGELTGSGRIITAVQDAGLEVQHEENLRLHYAMTLRDWNRNLRDNWDEAVAEVGVGTARVWGLYMAGSRIGFERNNIQLHHVLATKTAPDGSIDFPLRPTWGS
jgi:hypothetical protein